MRFSPLLFRNPNPNLLFSALRSPIRPRFGLSNRDLGTATPSRSSDFARVCSAMAAAAGVEEGSSAARRFWIRSRKEAAFAAYTPFVVSLAAGNLEVEAFRQYIAQDKHFLKAFAKAYEMAAEYADDDDEKAAILDLRKAALKELEMHEKEWGLDPNKEINPNPATVRYTDFLLATATGKVEGGKGIGKIATPFEKTKIAAYAVAAMTPCMRLYAHLGKEVSSFLIPNDGKDCISDLYKKWADNYASKEFEATAIQIEELLDKLSVTLTGEELAVLEKLYHQAMKLEAEFFFAQPITQPVVVPLTKMHDPKKPLIICSDFDLTCSVVDSSAILAEIALLTASKTDQSVADVPKVSYLEMKNSWNTISTQYTEEYEQCIESLLPKEEVKKFDHGGLYESLRKLSDFEKRANSRVIESEMLRGMNLDDIKRAGERLILHDGCTDFFQKVVKKKEMLNVDLHILSYCWCADLIRSAFSSVGCLNDLTIHSNEFNFKDSVSTGEITIKMESPIDKVEAFRNILESHGTGEKRFSVYIGDSVGDLLCLLEADVGLVVGSSESLRRVGKQFGVSFIPLYPGLINKQRQIGGQDSSIWKGLSGVLYTVSSWSEIQAFILGTH